MKKLFALMAICGVTLALTGCGAKKADDAGKDKDKPVAETPAEKPADNKPDTAS